MRHLTTKIRAAVGAAMIVAFASPAAAQRPPASVQTTRFEAQWLENRGPGRQLMPWQAARGRMASVAWRRGYARGHYHRGAAWGPRMRWRLGI